jgi:hypothetical protein
VKLSLGGFPNGNETLVVEVQKPVDEHHHQLLFILVSINYINN